MSSISGIGQSVIPYLQNLSVTPPPAPTDPTTVTAAQDPTSESTSSTQAVPGGHQHHHHGGGGGLFKQIQSADTSALQSAQSDGSSTDPNQIVQDAISQVLKNHQSGASAATTGTPASGADPDGDGDNHAAAGNSSTSGSSAPSAFSQLLQSSGVDAQQFQKDFLAAVQSVQTGGSTDPGSIFSNFPPGSVVDTLA